MIAATVFVLAFITAGLGTVFVAMRAGSRSSSKAPSRGSRRALVIGLPILFVIVGVGVPAIVLANNHRDHADIGPGGLVLTDNHHTNIDEVSGREAFAQHCSTCHTLHGANAVGKVGPNLDLLIGGLGGTQQSRAAFVLGAINQGRERGAGQMPAQLVVGRQATDVANFVAAVAGH
jgi:cytochrome c551